MLAGMGAMLTDAAVSNTQSSVAASKPKSELAFDVKHLRRFTMGDRPLEQEILRLFAENAPLIMLQLRHATTERAWRDATHTLKGSAGAVGAVRLARAAAEAERQHGDPAQWPSSMAQLDKALAATFSAIDPLVCDCSCA